ncbi:ribosomal protein S18 acetylase RimI-like enzyme [Hasllibacter halocynthiae]|uniref:Ribosomal protein S18 acetylase RimI-like enzyme n=1 Tax=Hasllibacter halocynthiae TaxID=595589 RepID=A0A2T0X1W3_9RHOB|nr:GNAT family N-acetyltransferase [Hasllibacter halocynthiae]PRY92943.1 ribosomal protein S18 acetylase RimI-like enzyme [Hasllibacter halocynthiae]
MSVRRARPGDADAVARVHVQAWREAYLDLLPHDVIASRTLEARRALWRAVIETQDEDTPVFVGEAEGEVAAFGKAGPQRTEALRTMGHTGEIWSLYALRAAHGRGLGRALMEAMLDALAARGHASAALWVLASSPSRGFYRHLGGTEVLEGEDAPGGAKEVALAFDLGARSAD